MITPDIIGERIKVAREKINMSQVELCEGLKKRGLSISRETLSKIENGSRNLAAIELKILCDALSISTEELLQDIDEFKMPKQIQDLNIIAFRGINNLVLEDLSDINIFFGYNNCGKTSVLEAIQLLINPSEISNVVNVSRVREGRRMNLRFNTSLYDSFINMFDKSNGDMRIDVKGTVINNKTSIELYGKIENMLIDLNEIRQHSIFSNNNNNENMINGEEETEAFIGELRYEFENSHGILNYPIRNTESIVYHKYIKTVNLKEENQLVKCQFISTTDHIVNNTFRYITKSKEVTQDIIQLLQIFDENIIDLRITQDDDGRLQQIIEHKKFGNMPLSTYGDGIKKVIALANGIVGSKNGILLIDEFETWIHKAIMRNVFEWLIKASKTFNVQLFITTHSQEAVDELLRSSDEAIDEDMVRIITLAKKDNKTLARILTGEKALYAIDEFNIELRK